MYLVARNISAIYILENDTIAKNSMKNIWISGILVNE